MDLSLFIAKRISIFEKKSFSLFISRIAILAIALSVSIMIIGTAITRGYQEKISEKFFNCWGQIHVTNFLPDPSNIFNDDKIEFDTTLFNNLKKCNYVKSVHPYTIQSTILKTKDGIEGIVLKGLHNNLSFSDMKNFLVDGREISFSNETYSKEILLSKTVMNNLDLKLNDQIILYFLNKNEVQPKARKVTIVGIFNTGLEEFDKLFSLCDSKLINNINKDSSNVIQGYEIYLSDISKTDIVEKNIFEKYIEAPLQVYTLQKRFANVFSWLGMMKMNETIIIVIMMIIAIINMISSLLILILERTQMIGLLKSLGMQNFQLQKIFLFTSLYIVGLGIIIGTLLGSTLCILQNKFGFIKLSEETYYINQVPIALYFSNVFFIILLTLIVCGLILIIPSFLVRKISPTKALIFK